MLRSKLLFGAALLVVTASLAHAAERPLTGPEITALLSGNTALGKNDRGPWKQYFEPGGGTAYQAGTDVSRGAWAVQGEKFCSQWPPNEKWTCYSVTGDVDANPKTVTWIGDGATYPGSVQAGDGL